MLNEVTLQHLLPDKRERLPHLDLCDDTAFLGSGEACGGVHSGFVASLLDEDVSLFGAARAADYVASDAPSRSGDDPC